MGREHPTHEDWQPFCWESLELAALWETLWEHQPFVGILFFLGSLVGDLDVGNLCEWHTFLAECGESEREASIWLLDRPILSTLGAMPAS